MNFKRSILFFLSIFFLAGFLGMDIPRVKAITTAELQAQIIALQAQLVQLQQQLAGAQGANPTWCHSFNTNLKIGDSGDEIKNLQTILEKEGFTINEKETSTHYFGGFTFSIVVRFQEKYKAEILSPLGLTRGTGFVGKGTRAKINTIYGCNVVQSPTPAPTPTPSPAPSSIPFPTPTPTPSIKLISPNGEESWKITRTYNITWESSGYDNTDKIRVSIIDYTNTTSLEKDIVSGLASNIKTYSWTIPSSFLVGSKYRIKVEICGTAKCYSDQSDNYFSVTLIEKTCSEIVNNQKIYFEMCRDATFDSACFNKFYGSYINCALSTLDDCTTNNINADQNIICSIPSITVVSPNGREKWTKGISHDIKWNARAVEKVNISLQGISSATIATNFSVWAGQYSWTIPAEIVQDSNYKIIIESATNWASDQSNSIFSIVDKLTPPCSTYGDLNKDGYVTSADVTLIENCVLRKITCTEEQKPKADVNKDGSVETSDVEIVNRYINGLETTFPACS